MTGISSPDYKEFTKILYILHSQYSNVIIIINLTSFTG